MPKTKMTYEQARGIGNALVAKLSRACVRIELAGSIRRKSPECGDIEIVCIAKRQKNLLGDADGPSLLDELLAREYQTGTFVARPKNGDKHKQFILPGGTQVDLFITTPECWPVIFALRTGPSQYSRALVTSRHHGGLLQNGCYVDSGRLYCEDEPVDLRDERHFFECITGGWLVPGKRG